MLSEPNNSGTTGPKRVTPKTAQININKTRRIITLAISGIAFRTVFTTNCKPSNILMDLKARSVRQNRSTRNVRELDKNCTPFDDYSRQGKRLLVPGPAKAAVTTITSKNYTVKTPQRVSANVTYVPAALPKSPKVAVPFEKNLHQEDCKKDVIEKGEEFNTSKSPGLIQGDHHLRLEHGFFNDQSAAQNTEQVPYAPTPRRIKQMTGKKEKYLACAKAIIIYVSSMDSSTISPLPRTPSRFPTLPPQDELSR